MRKSHNGSGRFELSTVPSSRYGATPIRLNKSMTERYNSLEKLKGFWNSIFPTKQIDQSTPIDPLLVLTEIQKEEYKLYDMLRAGEITEKEFKRRLAKARIVHGSGTHIPNIGRVGGTGPKNPDGSGGIAKDN